MPMNFKKKFNEINNMPMPSSINYNWNYGSLLGMTLMIQIITGILMSMYYISSVNEAFESIIHMTRNISKGWMIRSIHINGATMFFILIYMHMSKNIMMKSFKMKSTWNIGITILLTLMATAFMGYVLPWGQMSFWAATVITNLMSAIPIWGKSIVIWLWGGFSVSSPTLTRFFSMHFIMPFLIAMLSMIHIMTLHKTGSSNPISISMNIDKMTFHPFFSSKDLVSMMLMISMFSMFILFTPYITTDPENFIPANPMITPTHIQPEWYFLFAYAILRSIPSKLGGVMALMMSIMIFMIKTIQMTSKSSFKFNKKISFKFFILMHIFLILSWAGSKQIESPFSEMSMVYSLAYFTIILIL